MTGYVIHLLLYVVVGFFLAYVLLEAGYVDSVSMDLAAAFFVGMAYSILPDIDVPSSKTRKYASKTLLAFAITCLLAFIFVAQDYRLVYLSLLAIVFLNFLWHTKHRGIFHTIYAGALLSMPVYLMNPLYGSYAFAGFVSHLLADRKIL